MTRIAIFIAVSAQAAPTGGPPMPAWRSLSPYAHEMLGHVLPPPDDAMSAGGVASFLARYGTRSSTYLSVGMLWRDGPADRDNAIAVLRELLALQHDAPGERRHGVWRLAPGRDKLDENWREFVGVGLIVALEHFGNRLPPDLVEQIDHALERASDGAATRDVGPDYTNIAVMSAFLLDWAGRRFDCDGCGAQGLLKARAIYEAFRTNRTFSEYNSPTYYGVNLMGLALWRSLAASPDLRKWGAELEGDLWRDIGAFYHAGLRNMCGPHSRSYGMDMTEYSALAGLWIAMAIEDAGRAPLPPYGTAQKQGEWNYLPVFYLLGAEVPGELMPHLTAFAKPRSLERAVLARQRDHHVRAILERDWMMGAATGMGRSWDQHMPGTMHWRTGGRLGWLLVHGESAVDVRLDEGAMLIIQPEPGVARPLRIQLNAPGLTQAMIGAGRWSLPGFPLEVSSPLPAPTVEPLDDPRFGRVLEVRWAVPADTPPGTVLLTLRPLPNQP